MTKQSDSQKIKKKYASGSPGNVLNANYCYYETAPRKHPDLAIVCIGYEKCAPDFEIYRTNYPYYFVKYTIKGRGILWVDSKKFHLHAGSLSGFAPNDSHRYIADPQDPMEHIFVTFLGDKSRSLFNKSKILKTHCIQVGKPDEVLTLFNAILQLGTEKPEFSQEMCCAYLRILLLRQASHLSLHSVPFPVSRDTYENCKRYMDLNFSSIKSPGEVAQHCSIDVRYLSVLFKRYCHISPSQYLMQLKFNKATYMLLSTNLTIKEIALKIGFEDPYHFSRNFKKFHGCSPNDYRKNHA